MHQSQTQGSQSQSQGWPHAEPARPDTIEDEAANDAAHAADAAGQTPGAAAPADGAVAPPPGVGADTARGYVRFEGGHVGPLDAYPLPEVPRADALEVAHFSEDGARPAAHFTHPAQAPEGVVARPAFAAFALPEDAGEHLAPQSPQPSHDQAVPPPQSAMAVANAREQERHRRTAELAYRIAEENHFAPGMEEANWHEAERRLNANTASEAF